MDEIYSVRYLQEGEEVALVEELNHGFLVKRFYYRGDEYGNDGEDVGEVTEWVEHVYEVPPTEKYVKEVEELRDKINKSRIELGEIQDDVTRLVKERDTILKERDEKYKGFKALRNIDKFISGELSYLVFNTFYSGPEIINIKEDKEMKCGGDSREKDLKLLCLFGRTDGDLEWRLNRYSDGSGGYETCYPCVTYKEAVSKAQELLDIDIEERPKPSQNIVDKAEKYGLTLPEGYKESLEKNRIEDLEKNVKSREEDARVAREKLREARRKNVT